MSFAGLYYLTSWLGREGKIPGLNALHTLLIRLLPLLLAAYITLSRTQDYRHYFLDIMLGLMIGVVFAWGSYAKYHNGRHLRLLRALKNLVCSRRWPIVVGS